MKDRGGVSLDVVVCVKNRASSIERLLRQVGREVPFRNLIVVYGSSEDGTREIAEKYTDQVFWDEDRGLGSARSLGIRKASSEIVAMIDSDVILKKGWYHQLVGHFENPKVAAVMGTCIYGYGCRPLEGLWRDYQWSLRENWGCHNTMFRRDIVLGVGNFSEAIKGPGEDFDLYLRLLDSGYRWVWVREAVVYHPMTLSEYVARMYRWSRGLPYIRSLMREAASKSLSTVYQNSLFSVVEGFRNGIVLSARVHPTLLLYFPLLKIVSQFAGLNELKRTLRSRDQGPQQMHVP